MQIYLVIGSSGDYDDFHEWPEVAFLSNQKATKRAADLNQSTLEKLKKGKHRTELVWYEVSTIDLEDYNG